MKMTDHLTIKHLQDLLKDADPKRLVRFTYKGKHFFVSKLLLAGLDVYPDCEYLNITIEKE